MCDSPKTHKWWFRIWPYIKKPRFTPEILTKWTFLKKKNKDHLER